MSCNRNRLIVLAVVLLASWLAALLLSDAGFAPPGKRTYGLRVSRVAMGALAGAALSVAGMAFQAVFRNPLAEPYTLGVSSGASLGAALAFFYGLHGLWHGLPMMTLLAFAGACGTMVVVYGVARIRRGFSTATLLLAGISIAFICSAVILLLWYVGRKNVTTETIRWLMGSVEVVGYLPILRAGLLVGLAVVVIFGLHRELDLLMMGELAAAGRGVDVRRARRLVYFAASLATGAVVAHCGPIGFVGLIVPHVMRQVIGPTHGLLLPGCLLGGAAFLPLADGLGRSLVWWLTGESQPLPVGVLTSLVGGGFFLYLLLTRRQERPII